MIDPLGLDQMCIRNPRTDDRGCSVPPGCVVEALSGAVALLVVGIAQAYGGPAGAVLATLGLLVAMVLLSQIRVIRRITGNVWIVLHGTVLASTGPLLHSFYHSVPIWPGIAAFAAVEITCS